MKFYLGQNVRTIAWKTISQIALRNSSKEVGWRSVYMWFCWRGNMGTSTYFFFCKRFLLVMSSCHHLSIFLDMRGHKNRAHKIGSWKYLPEDLFFQFFPEHQFSSFAQSCPTFCDPMNHSTPGPSVHHQLLEFTQTYVHRVSDAIQLSHPLSSPSPPALNLSQHQGLFKWVSSSHWVAKILEFQLQNQSCQQPASLLLSTLSSFQGVLAISSCSSTWFNPCRGKWQLPMAGASL